MPSQEFYALLDACRRGDVDTATALLDAQDDLVNTADEKGYTPLIIAAYNGHEPMVHTLLRRGADLQAGDGAGNTALMGAAFKGYADIVDALLKAGADVNARNSQRANALTFAATFGQLEIARTLLEAGADRFAQDLRGKTPLDHAVIQENMPMVELIEGWENA